MCRHEVERKYMRESVKDRIFAVCMVAVLILLFSLVALLGDVLSLSFRRV